MKKTSMTVPSQPAMSSSSTFPSSLPRQPAGVPSPPISLPPQPHGMNQIEKVSIRSSTTEPSIQMSLTSISRKLRKGVPGIKVHEDAVWAPIDEVTIYNFKAVSKATVALGSEVTILVGASASGKSSILQAMHWLTKSAGNAFVEEGGKEISFDKLDYVPSGDPIGTLHNGRLRRKSKHPSIGVVFRHSQRSKRLTRISLRASKNMNGVNVDIKGDMQLKSYIQNNKFVSTYIPGLVGLSEKEKKSSKKAIWRSASSGDAGSSLRNILLLLATEANGLDVNAGEYRLKELNFLVSDIFPNLKIDVKYDEAFDRYISVSVRDKGDYEWTLESTSSGVLKVIQIFAYIVYFRPKITLIEEPDSHLHPRAQRYLIEMLERTARKFGTQIVITTHSQYVVQGASERCSIAWVKNGRVVPVDDGSIRDLMGWNGLDISVIFFVEDRDYRAIESILRQWPEIYRQTGVCSCGGSENLPRADLVEGILKNRILDVKFVLHRDGDFMTEAQIEMWKKKYSSSDAFLWLTEGSDVEEYFCSPEYLSLLYDIREEQAKSWINDALDIIDRSKKSRTEAKSAFVNKRNHNFQYLKIGNHDQESKRDFQKDTEDIWKNAGVSAETVTGKTLHEYLVVVAGENGKDESLLRSFKIPKRYNRVAEGLKVKIEEAINSENSDSHE